MGNYITADNFMNTLLTNQLIQQPLGDTWAIPPGTSTTGNAGPMWLQPAGDYYYSPGASAGGGNFGPVQQPFTTYSTFPPLDMGLLIEAIIEYILKTEGITKEDITKRLRHALNCMNLADVIYFIKYGFPDLRVLPFVAEEVEKLFKWEEE